MGENLILRSMNVRGLNGNHKRSLVFKELSKYKNDILLLQDTHTCTLQEKIWKNKWGPTTFFSHGETNSRGLCTIIPKTFQGMSELYYSDMNGRILIVKLTMENTIYYVVNVYAPVGSKHNEQLEFLELLNTQLAELKDSNLLLCGDWNTVLDFNLDRKGGSDNFRNPKYRDNLITLIDEYDLSDCWRLYHPNKRKYTWRKDNQSVFSRLDMWFISSNLLNILSYSIIEPGIKTDHSMIKIGLKLSNFKRGKGIWKFNNKLFHDKIYVKLIKDLINSENDTIGTYEDKGFAWDYLKMRIRSETIEYTGAKNKEKREYIRNLNNRLDKLDEQIPVNNQEDLIVERESILRELDSINNEKLQGSIFRSKSDWTEFGEKNNKYFLNLEKYNSSNKIISKIVNSVVVNGKVQEVEIMDKKLIDLEIRKYYQNLYSQNTTDHSKLNEILKDIPKLSQTDMEHTRGIITYIECLKALKTLPNGKTPGIDGITTDFYKFFWNDVSTILLDSLNYAFKKGEMSSDQRMGVITLSPKKDKIRHYLKNWRPITLLTVDYKLIAKTMALRLEKIMPHYINETQFGYVKGRYIGENIRCVIDINDVCTKNNINAFAIQIDFEKAFDSVNWDFMLISLAKMNFSEDFIRWVSLMYRNCKSSVLNNGNLTESFNLRRGVHQGCPLSALLFIILVQVLQHMLHKRTDISALTINNREIKILQMADDTTLFTSRIEDIPKLMKVLKVFHAISGLKTNVDKTIAYILGANNTIKVNDARYGLLWKKLPISLLGIQITKDENESCKNNFENKIESIKVLTRIWASRNLTLKGKITIINSLLIPKLIYPCSILDTPQRVIKIVDKILLDFMWNWKTPKIRKDYLIRKIETGGIKAPCLECKVRSWKLNWAIRCLKQIDPKPLWVDIVAALLPTGIDLTYLLICNPTRNFLLEYCPLLPTFYINLIVDWTKINMDNNVNTKEKIANQPIWLNSKVVANKKPLFCRASIKKIKIIGELLDKKYTFKDLNKINTEYNLRWTFLDYMKIRQTIPHAWRQILCGTLPEDNTKNPILEKLKRINTLKTRDIYWLILNDEHDLLSIPNAHQYWVNKYKFTDDMLRTTYILPYRATKATYIQSLQYKILYRIVNCNYWLHKVKILDSPICSLCDHPDTIEHYFFACKETKLYWKAILNWWNSLNLMYINEFQEDSIIIGMPWVCEIGKVLNCCILIGKVLIYKSKNCKIQPTLTRFLIDLKDYIYVEENISIKNNTYTSFEKEWGDIILMI